MINGQTGKSFNKFMYTSKSFNKFMYTPYALIHYIYIVSSVISISYFAFQVGTHDSNFPTTGRVRTINEHLCHAERSFLLLSTRYAKQPPTQTINTQDKENISTSSSYRKRHDIFWGRMHHTLFAHPFLCTSLHHHLSHGDIKILLD